MGFFKNIFKKKRGGTVVGNLIRGVASTATGGALGSGVALKNWEAKQDAKEKQALHNEIASLRKSIDGRQMGEDLVKSAVKNGAASGQTDPNLGEHIVLTTLKKHWAYITGGLLVVGLMIYLLTRKKNSGGKFKFRR